MNLEELAQKLIVLANKPVLTKLDHEESQKLMIELKKSGMSNAEISELSGGKWSLVTVKGYTGGVKAIKHSPWPNAISALTELITNGLSLEEISEAIEVNGKLKSNKVNLEEIVDFLKATDSASIDPAIILQWMQEITQSGLSVGKIKEAIGLKGQLEANEFPLGSLPALVKLAGTYGDFQKVMDAVTAYGALSTIKSDIGAADEHLEKIKAEADSANNTLQKTEAKISGLGEQLEALEKVKKLGYSQSALADLAKLTDKLGGVKEVFKALNKYADLAQLRSDILGAESILKALKSEIADVEAKNSHLASAVEMCRTLLTKYKFGIDAIGTILSVADNYGSATEVLKALEAYGKIEKLNAEVDGLQGKVASLKQTIAQLAGEHKQSIQNLESLIATALTVGKEVGKVQSDLASNTEIKKLLELINNPLSADYDGHITNAMLLAYSLRNWVSENAAKFKYSEQIKSALGNLLIELGGGY